MKDGNQGPTLEDAKRLARSGEAQKLLALLQQGDPEGLRQVMEQAERGNFQQAGQILSGLMASPEAKALAEKLRRGSNG